MKWVRSAAIGALLGVIPGVILVILTVPVSGEMELTLGASGIGLMAVGAPLGALLAVVWTRGA